MEETTKLIEGTFTASEAKTLIGGLFEQKINFHKINRLRDTEGNADADTTADTERIKELQEEMQHMQKFFNTLATEGKKEVRLSGTITISS